MTPILRTAITLAIFYLPAVIVLATVIRLRMVHEKAARLPFTDKPLRLPGESARQKADQLWDSANEKMLMIILGGPALGVAYALTPGRKPVLIGAVLFAIVLLGSLILGLRIREALSSSWKYRLGATGEQVVGRELDRLIAKGHQVFHDVPFDGWNIDHVVVGPNGVFAVETKTRRKPHLKPGEKAVVFFDGEHLNWLGRWPDRKPVEQAKRNARSLEKWIADETAEQVSIVPVLALPGWSLKMEKYGEVAVYSAFDMSVYMPQRGKGQLMPNQIQRIAHQLAKICAMNST